jgi:hypothetical protein
MFKPWSITILPALSLTLILSVKVYQVCQ